MVAYSKTSPVQPPVAHPLSPWGTQAMKCLGETRGGFFKLFVIKRELFNAAEAA